MIPYPCKAYQLGHLRAPVLLTDAWSSTGTPPATACLAALVPLLEVPPSPLSITVIAESRAKQRRIVWQKPFLSAAFHRTTWGGFVQDIAAFILRNCVGPRWDRAYRASSNLQVASDWITTPLDLIRTLYVGRLWRSSVIVHSTQYSWAQKYC